MEISLKGRNALITGASQGLGKAMAERFASSGARVALVARSKENLDAVATGIGDAAMAFPCDITDTDQLEQLYKDVDAKFGQVDILINNAGSSARGSFLEVSDAIWQADLDLKLFAAIRFGRHYIPAMMERKWGRVINVVSTAAKAQPGASVPTSVTRAAGMALAKVMSKEGAPHNVLVNALLVGKIDSEQWAKRWRADNDGSSYADFLAKMGKESGIPLGRMGESDEFARMACFLVSDAGSYITGCAINVDGGMSPVV